MQSNLKRSLALVTGFLTLVAAWSSHAATNVWFSPDGKGDGWAADRPRRYTTNFMTWGLLHGAPGQDRDLRMHFYPGEYLVAPINTVTTQPSDWRIRIDGLGKNPEDVVLKMKPNVTEGISDRGGDWVDVIDLARNSEYLQRFEMENVTVDGNWTGQTNVNHAGYLRAYKNSPLYVSARTGRIRRVIIRNYGAHGFAPHRTNDLGAGVEVFPLHIWTRDEGQQPEGGDPRPWVVEDCEVADFHGYYNGYTSCLMAVARLNVANTPPWAFEDTQGRLIWYRRNQVRGVPAGVGVIALGAAGLGTNITGKVTWSDNVVLNAAVFNTDTGWIRHLDFTNCLGLDVSAVGYVGTHSTRSPVMKDYNISNNSFRFGWIFTQPDYRNFKTINRPDGRLGALTDPALEIGRPQFPVIAGLTLQGIAQDIRFTDNWFTSRSREEFGSLNPLFPRDPRFRIVHRLPSKDPAASNAPVFFRQEPLDMNLSDNRISSVPFDFQSMKPLAGGRFAKLADGSSPLMELREALPAPSGFIPLGPVDRVEMMFTNVSLRIPWKGIPVGVTNGPPQEGVFQGVDRALIGAVEVICGRPAAVGPGGVFRLPVRVAFQPTPLAHVQGTTPLPGRRVFLEVLSGSRHPQRLVADSDPQGIATFTWPVAADASGVDYFRAWTDGGNGRNGEWDEYQDAWATAHYAHGRTIGVRVETDIANAESGNPGRIRLLREGPDDRSLTVNLALQGGAHAATLGSDFRLVGPKKKGYPGGPDGAAADVGTTVEFPRGQREVTLQVEPIPGKARSGRLVTLRIQPGDGYAPGEPPQGEVALYSPVTSN
ncbi:MAG: hypothetical protein RIS76_1460 [Verrucomicrobiota bacterium]|jgi:hypothetical protein